MTGSNWKIHFKSSLLCINASRLTRSLSNLLKVRLSARDKIKSMQVSAFQAVIILFSNSFGIRCEIQHTCNFKTWQICENSRCLTFILYLQALMVRRVMTCDCFFRVSTYSISLSCDKVPWMDGITYRSVNEAWFDLSSACVKVVH